MPGRQWGRLVTQEGVSELLTGKVRIFVTDSSFLLSCISNR